ncbi:hypothetical protein KSP40_PGU021137 [Platanthera guangdongensis]|uniref:Tf2-1-like SH3-like domain-containing protein n=1 Tax=Platanthera guangdongensis TaxID=2320717 RepID=A0ABR2MN86_9ASPA
MCPYSIISRIGTNAYRLDIPASMRIHPLLNVENLTPYFEAREYVDPSSGDNRPSPPPFSLPYHSHTPPTSNNHYSPPTTDTHPPGDSSSLVSSTTPSVAPGSTIQELRDESITEVRAHQFVPTTDGLYHTLGSLLVLGRRQSLGDLNRRSACTRKDPEFYQYLKEHDKELLEFNDKDTQDDERSDLEDGVDAKPTTEKFQTPSTRVITTTKVDSWCSAIKQQRSLGAVRSMLRAFRTACHHGDDTQDDSEQKFTVVSSSVFNKIMVFVLNEMDGILRKLLEAPSTGGKKEIILDLMTTKAWKAHGSLMRLYLGNTLHILNEMTDEQMISFTLKRLIASTVFLAAFPVLLRKYIRVVLHTWGTGTGALPVVSFLFMRDLCVRLGSDCLDSCLKGMYKAYIMNCKLPKHISSSKLQHINFLGNCVSELYGLDPLSAYQHAFVSIRQLAVILREVKRYTAEDRVVAEWWLPRISEAGCGTVTEAGRPHMSSKKSYQKVYDWQFIFCLELWTKVISTYSSEADFGPLAYPLSQIIYGVATLVPTARYFPLRLRCIRMMNCIAGATERFIPVSSLLLDMLEMKVLSSSPTGGVGKAVDMQCVKKLDKQTLKTRSFQEVCIYSIVEELAEHFAQWSYSIAFFELSFITLVRLRSFCKSTKVDRFRREVKELIRQLEANCNFTNSKRIGIGFSPSDPAAAIFLKACKVKAVQKLSSYTEILQQAKVDEPQSLKTAAVVVGAESSMFGSKFSEADREETGGDEEEAAAAFGSSWMPAKKSKATKKKSKLSKKHHRQWESDVASAEDVVEDLVLSSDEDEDVEDDDDGVCGYGEFDDNRESHKNKIKQSKKRARRDFPTQKKAAGAKSKRKGPHRSKRNARGPK